jgi:hypothetical protein
MNNYLTVRRRPAIVGGLLILSGLVLHGCASSRVLRTPLPPTQADVGFSAAAPEGLTVEVHQLIFRNSGGSWVRDANWDEYVLMIKNDSQGAVEIQGINLYSDKLPAPVESSTSREQLDTRSNSTMRALKDVGIVAGVGVVAPSALIVGAIGTSGGILSASSGAAALAIVGILAIPVGLIGGTTYVISRRHRDTEDKALIDRRLSERGYAVPLRIDPQTQVTKSAFFPITPAPTRLVVSYATLGGVRAIALELPALAGLHLKAPPVKVARANTASIPAPGSTF